MQAILSVAERSREIPGITDDVAGKRPRKRLQQVILGTCEVRDCKDAIASRRGRVRPSDLECLAFIPYSGEAC